MQVLVNRLLISLALSEFSLSALATSGEGSHGVNWWHLGSAYKDAPAIGWLSITFIIFVWGIVVAVRKPLSLYLETRSKDIRRKIEEGQFLKAESEKKLAEYESKLKSLDAQIASLSQAFSETARAEKEEMIRLLGEAEGRIQKEATDMIAAEYARSKNRLSKEVMEVAITKATAKLRSGDLESLNKNLTSDLIADLKKMTKDENQCFTKV